MTYRVQSSQKNNYQSEERPGTKAWSLELQATMTFRDPIRKQPSPFSLRLEPTNERASG